METLLLILIAVAVVLVALLAVPLELAVAASLSAPDAPLEKRVRLRWAFGLVDVPLGRRRPPAARRARPRAEPKPREKRPKRVRLGRLLINPAAWRRAKVLLARLFGVLRWRELRLHARIGLDDPADTGRLWGTVGPLTAILLPADVDVQVRPVFEGPELVLQGAGEVRLVPLRVLWVLLSFALSPATWRVVWPALRRC